MANDNHDNDNSTSYLPGGTVRVTTAMDSTPASEAEHPEFSGQGVVNGGVSISGGRATDIGAVHRTNSSELAPNVTGTLSIISTLQNQAGHPQPASKAHPDFTVELHPGDPTTRISLDAAERLGYIQRNPQGGWSQPDISPEQAEQAIDRFNTKQESAAVERFNNPDAERLMSPDVHGLPESVFAAELAKAAAGGQPDLNKLAAMSGKSAQELGFIVTALSSAFGGQAQRVASECGVTEGDWANFSTWAQTNRPDALKSAVQQQVVGRSTAGLRALARDYMNSTTPSQGALQRAGMQAWVDHKGVEWVKLPASKGGFTTTVAEAVRAGFL
jgi:hypothetical protein